MLVGSYSPCNSTRSRQNGRCPDGSEIILNFQISTSKFPICKSPPRCWVDRCSRSTESQCLKCYLGSRDGRLLLLHSAKSWQDMHGCHKLTKFRLTPLDDTEACLSKFAWLSTLCCCRHLLPYQPAKFRAARNCIHNNYLFIKSLLSVFQEAGEAPEHLSAANSAAAEHARRHKHAQPGDIEKVR